MSSVIYGCRASLSIDDAQAGTPVIVTQTLSDLRLSHARLLEEHGANTALLRQREAYILESEQRETELQETIGSIQQQLRSAEEQLRQRETRFLLAEREIGFLQALLASYDAAQEAGVDTRIDVNLQKVEELQKLLEAYKERNQQLETDASLFPGGKSQHELSKAIEIEREEKLSLQQGLFFVLIIFHRPTVLLSQILTELHLKQSNNSTRLKSSSKRSLNFEEKWLVVGTSHPGCVFSL